MPVINVSTAEILQWYKEAALPPKIAEHLNINDITADPTNSSLHVHGHLKGPLGISLSLHLEVGIIPSTPAPNGISVTILHADAEGISVHELLNKILPAVIQLVPGLKIAGFNAIEYALPAYAECTGVKVTSEPDLISVDLRFNLSKILTPLVVEQFIATKLMGVQA